MSSIRQRLLLYLLSGLLAAVLAAAASVYVKAREEANDLFDYHLKQMALSLPDAAFGQVPGREDTELQGFVIQVWDRNGVKLYFSQPTSQLPQYAALGFSTVATPHGHWRVFSVAARHNVIQVAQPMSVRRELAAGMALRTVVPLLLLLPIIGVLIWITVGRGLQPLNQVASAVGKRSPSALQPLPEDHLPLEVKPLVRALNDLLARLGRALETQRAFIADAAHELRTPLTALQLQIQLAERAQGEAEREAAFARVKEGLKRSNHLVEQLLTLARQEPQAAERPFVPVDLLPLARQVVAEFALLAQQKSLDLGVSGEQPATVAGDPEALRVMLNNLVDNAVRYTPSGGRIDVTVGMEQSRPAISVTDSGPGIPPEERERVFDRFYRREGSGVAGSGLGLAIARNIAERHNARVSLDAPPGGRGLAVKVVF